MKKSNVNVSQNENPTVEITSDSSTSFESTSIDFDHDGDLDMVLWSNEEGKLIIFEYIGDAYESYKTSLLTDFFGDNEFYFINEVSPLNSEKNRVEIILMFNGAGGQKRKEIIEFDSKLQRWTLVESIYITDFCDSVGNCKTITCRSIQNLDLREKSDWENYIYPLDKDCLTIHYKLEE